MILAVELGDVLPSQARSTLLQIEPRLASLVFSSSLPGGFNGCTVDLTAPMITMAGPRPGMDKSQWARPFGNLRVKVGSLTAWEGRIQHLRHGTNGGLMGLGAVGYGMAAAEDFWYSSASSTASTSGAILAAVLAANAPWLSKGQGLLFQDPGIVHAARDFSGMTPGAIAAQIVSEGGASGVGFDYAVWDGRAVSLTPRTPPTHPDYRISFDKRVAWEEEYGEVYPRCTVEYTDTISGDQIRTAALFNQVALNTWGNDRHKLLNAGTMTAVGALAYGATWLAAHAVPEYQVTISLGPGEGLALISGVEVPGWTIRAGRWVQIGDRPMLPIIAATYTSETSTTVLQCGSPAFDLAAIIADTLQNAARAADGLQISTGARLTPW